jgi:MFS family permease
MTKFVDPAESTALACLFFAKALRDFGDGFVAVLLPLYLVRLGYSAFAVGVLAAAALLGSALLTLAVGVFGGRYDPRRLLLAGSALMAATGLALAISDVYALLLLVAFAGTVNPSAGSASAFVPIEHAVLVREADQTGRTRAFARYSLFGSLGGLKTPRSKRRIPIHPELIRLGFLDYVKKIAATGSDLLFPDLRERGENTPLGDLLGKQFEKLITEVLPEARANGKNSIACGTM